MSPVEERIERLEEWRSRSELRAGRLLEQVAAIARSIERIAETVQTHGEVLVADRERRRLRRAAWGALSAALAALAGLGGFLAR